MGDLRSIQLPPSVTTVGDGFAAGSAVAHLDLELCESLRTIGANFCARRRLSARRFSTGHHEPITLPASVATIGAGFCRDCSCVTALDLSSCRELRTIGNRFAQGAVRLEAVVFPTSL